MMPQPFRIIEEYRVEAGSGSWLRICKNPEGKILWVELETLEVAQPHDKLTLRPEVFAVFVEIGRAVLDAAPIVEHE